MGKGLCGLQYVQLDLRRVVVSKSAVLVGGSLGQAIGQCRPGDRELADAREPIFHDDGLREDVLSRQRLWVLVAVFNDHQQPIQFVDRSLQEFRDNSGWHCFDAIGGGVLMCVGHGNPCENISPSGAMGVKSSEP